MERDNITFWELHSPDEQFSPEELANARLEVCKRCVYFDDKYDKNKCSLCGCSMTLSFESEKSHCPINKW